MEVSTMTCSHFAHSIIYKSGDSSLIASAAYNARRDIFDETENVMKHSHTKNNDIIEDEMLLPHGAPAKYKNVNRIFNDILKIENDKLAYKMQFSFQWELTFEQNLTLIKELLRKEFVSKGHAVHLAIHGDKERFENNAEDKGNVHAHVIVIDRRLVNGKWDDRKSETVYFLRDSVKAMDKHGKVINPDAVRLTVHDKILSPKLKRNRLQYDAQGNVITEKGWLQLQYDNNGKPLLDNKGFPVMIDIREPLYENNDLVAKKLKYSKNGKSKKLQYKRENIKHSNVSDIGNLTRIRKTWEELQNEAYRKYNILDENGNILQVDLRSYDTQNKDRPEDEQLIPTRHVGYRRKTDKASEKPSDIVLFNEEAKKHNNYVKELKQQRHKLRNLQKQLQRTQDAVSAEDRDDIKFVNDLNLRKTFVDDYASRYNNMLRRRKRMDAAILRLMEDNMVINDTDTKKIDRSTKRGKAGFTRLRRHKALLNSLHQKLSQELHASFSIKSAAGQLFDTFDNEKIVSYVAARYGKNTADITANVLERIQPDASNPFNGSANASPYVPTKNTIEEVLNVASKAITGNPDIDDVKKNALSEWSLKPGEAPPNSILKIIDTFHTATDFYEAKITDEKWFKTRFSDANPDEINQDFQEELTKITEEEKIEAELKAESFNTPVWTEEEYKRLSAIRDTHYENLISAAQPYTSDDLHKTQRTKALKIVREILFEDKYQLLNLYENAAAAAKNYYGLKNKAGSSSDGKTIPSVNLAPDHNRPRSSDTVRKK